MLGQSSRRTIHHKPAQSRRRRGVPGWPVAEQGRSFRSRHGLRYRRFPLRRTRRTGVKEMTICGEIETGRRARMSRKMRIVLFFTIEGAAALLIGFAAL